MNNSDLFLLVYISVSFGVWLGAAFVNFKSFQGASPLSIVRGFAGAFCWPLLVVAIIFYGTKGLLNAKNH